MQANLHHPLHWVHDEAVLAGHWCSAHMLHDYRFWIYLLIAVVFIALLALLLTTGGGTVLDHELRYYAYPYSAF